MLALVFVLREFASGALKKAGEEFWVWARRRRSSDQAVDLTAKPLLGAGRGAEQLTPASPRNGRERQGYRIPFPEVVRDLNAFWQGAFATIDASYRAPTVKTLTAPMMTASDTAASGGAYVTVAAGNNSQTSAPSTGHASFTFTGPAGSYKVWGRVIAPADTDDSFWVRMDSASWINWNNITPGSAWHWDDVHNGTASATVTYPLSAGTHTLTFAYREDGTRLDRVLITNDLAFTPSGLGQ